MTGIVDPMRIVDLDGSNAGKVADARPAWAQAVPGWLERVVSGRSHVLVACLCDEPVGVAELALGDPPELRNVGVLPARQGCGIGTGLMEEAESRARESGSITLGVGIDNPGARRLYERRGYRYTGERTTTIYEYVDDQGYARTATETDESMVKVLPASLGA